MTNPDKDTRVTCVTTIYERRDDFIGRYTARSQAGYDFLSVDYSTPLIRSHTKSCLNILYKHLCFSQLYLDNPPPIISTYLYEGQLFLPRIRDGRR